MSDELWTAIAPIVDAAGLGRTPGAMASTATLTFALGSTRASPGASVPGIRSIARLIESSSHSVSLLLLSKTLESSSSPPLSVRLMDDAEILERLLPLALSDLLVSVPELFRPAIVSPPLADIDCALDCV
uniref:Uncharacterized protein n=1 Tax=Anopheles melas TaxID=34690 RepID=A0A182UJ94_9DIPT